MSQALVLLTGLTMYRFTQALRTAWRDSLQRHARQGRDDDRMTRCATDVRKERSHDNQIHERAWQPTNV